MLKNVEIFEMEVRHCKECGAYETDPFAVCQDCKGYEFEKQKTWAFWYCLPGCLPDCDPIVGFDSYEEAEREAVEFFKGE